MLFHIINGDALLEIFPIQRINGNLIVIREAFIDGPVSNVYDSSYWSKRKNFIQDTYGKAPERYDDDVKSEFHRLQKISNEDEVYLWFEDDLFCQCNMWFAVDFISKHSHPQFHRVFPKADVEHWRGFGNAEPQNLIQYFQQAITLSSENILHIVKLWKALVESDTRSLVDLSKEPCAGIRFQEEVIKAHLDREPDRTGYGRPQRVLKHLLQQGEKEFYSLFDAFSRQEGIYGFGDEQIRQMLKEVETTS